MTISYTLGILSVVRDLNQAKADIDKAEEKLESARRTKRQVNQVRRRRKGKERPIQNFAESRLGDTSSIIEELRTQMARQYGRGYSVSGDF